MESERATANVKWCPGAESNHRHCDFQSHALPTELPGHAAGPKTQASGRFIVRSGGCVHPPSPSATARQARLRRHPQIIGKSALFGVRSTRLVSVREEVESYESFVIQERW